jgi:hypothetical protein
MAIPGSFAKIWGGTAQALYRGLGSNGTPKSVASGVSLRRIKSYLLAWCTWWVQTAKCWTQNELLTWFTNACWDAPVATIAASLLGKRINPGREADLKPYSQRPAFYQL